MGFRVQPQIPKITGKLRILRDYTSVALMHPELLKEAARTIIHRKFRRLTSELRALNEVECKSAKSLPEFPFDLVKILAEEIGVLILEESPRHIRIGVIDRDFLLGLIRIQLSVPFGQFRVGEQLIRLVSSQDRRAALMAQEITFTFSCVNCEEARLTLEPYMQRLDGVWLSNNTENSRARALYSDILCTPGLYPLSQILPAPTLEMRASQKSVDVVYAWTDHTASGQNQEYQRHSREAASFRTNAGSVKKLRDERLRFSLRSVAANLPWTRNIYIFTNSSVPGWMKSDHPGIVWIDHKDVISDTYLPTFSSRVIESFLHRIPDLSEQFIYIQNGAVIAQPMDKSTFFHPAGYSYSFVHNYEAVSESFDHDDSEYLNASRNSAQLIQETFGVTATQRYSHMVSALRRDLLMEMEARWPDQFEAFRQNPLCAGNDLNVTSFLYHHYAINTGRAITIPIDLTMVKQLDVYWNNEHLSVLRKIPRITYIDEGELRSQNLDSNDTALKFLQSAFPVKSSWER